MDDSLVDKALPRWFEEKLLHAWAVSRAAFGREVTFYLPGMFRYEGITGRYPAVSITGSRCELMCEHCRGSLLKSMPDASEPERLLAICRSCKDAGYYGVLISGGCDKAGRLPWDHFADTIARAKEETGLYITVHCGIVKKYEADLLKSAGVDQALLDVVGDDETYRRIYHADLTVSDITKSMEALKEAGIDLVPHVVCGLYFGNMKSEKNALKLIVPFDVPQVVIVSVMPPDASGKFVSPAAEEVADLIADARIMMPRARVALGCARKRGDIDMEVLALRAGVNRMAIPSGEAVEAAKGFGLKPLYQRSCCSVSLDTASENW